MSDHLPPVAGLMPHHDPMVLIQRLTKLESDYVRAETRFPFGSLGGRDNEPSSAWSLEIISQACAAFIGYHHQESAYRQGHLIKASNWILRANTLPLNSLLTVEATLEMSSTMGLFVFEGKLSLASGTPLANGQLSILAR